MQEPKKNFFSRLWDNVRREAQWFRPGLGYKRWLILVFVGTTLISVGLAMFFLDFYRNAPDTWWLPIISTLSLRFLDRPIRVIVFGGIGLVLVILGIWGSNRSLLRPFVPPGKPLIEALEVYRRRDHGPRIVVLGGGHGLAALLRGLKAYTHNLTAIVTVADDGGSSGQLRRNLGVLPPGDIRNCLAALSNNEDLLSQVFQYRFADGAGLEGHSLGNLFITALSEITGSFEEAVAESGRVLAVYGQVLPSTLTDVQLLADLESEGGGIVSVSGETQIRETEGKVRRIWLDPANTPAFPPAISAVLSADLIIIGPGSLYSSLLPNLLVRDLAEAVRISQALKFFICNVATERGETDSFNCIDHVRAVEAHVGSGMFDLVICNNHFVGHLGKGVDWVRMDPDLIQHSAVYCANLIDADHPWRHDSLRLSKTVMDLFFERTGPLIE
ncbi:MAG: gluconeogenesis factor YvcK family protein [Chloroflexota bacterium]|nr:gluconeogenesis factor YvcK family protein [Chloroflexota bacterium]